jgi:hypothetical protein
MSLDQIIKEALLLPRKDRAELAASLWESVEESVKPPLPMDDADALGLAEARDGELESGSVTAISHRELMEFLRR